MSRIILREKLLLNMNRRKCRVHFCELIFRIPFVSWWIFQRES